jgi:hypothetical protein
VTADILSDNIVERSTLRYVVTEVLNMWEVSMAGSHTGFTEDLIALSIINLPIYNSTSTVVLTTSHPTHTLYSPYWCKGPKFFFDYNILHDELEFLRDIFKFNAYRDP